MDIRDVNSLPRPDSKPANRSDERGQVSAQPAGMAPAPGVGSQSAAEVAAAVEKLNAAASNAQHGIHFSVHEGTGRTIIEVTDKTTGESVRSIPPKELLSIAEHLAEALARGDTQSGLLLDQQV